MRTRIRIWNNQIGAVFEDSCRGEASAKADHLDSRCRGLALAGAWVAAASFTAGGSETLSVSREAGHAGLSPSVQSLCQK